MTYILLSFFAFILYNYYLFLNIKSIGSTYTGAGSSGMSVLLISFILLSLLIFWQTVIAKYFYIRKSFLVLLSFFIYFVLKICLDIGSMAELKAATVSTTGGIFFFYFIGAMMSIILYRMKILVSKSNQCTKMLFVVFWIYLFCNSYCLFDAFAAFSANVRTDAFLIDDINGEYQRPGAFLVISSMILSVLYMNTLLSGLLKFKNKFMLSLLRIVCFCIYAINLLAAMLISQLIGSNNALICISGMLLLAIVFHVFLLLPKVKLMLNNKIIKIKSIVFGRVSGKIINSLLIGIVSFVIILFFVISYMDIDLSTFRITGFGTGEVSSVDTRYRILQTFPIQFFYSDLTPFFGNMRVHELIGGAYIHSFLGSILTHLGITGFVIFIYFVYLSIIDLFQKDFSSDIYINGMNIYKMLLFTGIFIIATSAVFMTWGPLWFLIGLLFLPIRIIKI